MPQPSVFADKDDSINWIEARQILGLEADSVNSHDKAENNVESRIFLTAPSEHNSNSGADSVLPETPSDMTVVNVRTSLPYSDEATQSGIQADGYVSKLEPREMVSGPRPTVTVYIVLP
ncbi:hypothetical protein F5883DRAFT_653193 [Diaporthe sp. PMI_573]|nr:hypothetical protein F5883DRAFT_653193 [Diaporthaceae sp. PMI_573]